MVPVRGFVLAAAAIGFAYGLGEFCAEFLHLQPWWSAPSSWSASPVSPPSPAPSSSSPSTPPSAAPAQFGRVVLLLIDALRPDMAYGGAMPYTKSLLGTPWARPYVSLAHTPTVTLPRIRAMMTGRKPQFIDALRNLGEAAEASSNTDDSVVEQLRRAGRRLVLCGDETWLRLFPHHFTRADPTTSFFAKDFVEVDDNVTRHIEFELDPSMEHERSRDWDVLVMHLLGLDHIGHQLGPRAPRMAEKQREIDGVLRRVREALLRQDEVRAQEAREARNAALPTLLVLLSDHGMTAGGNHGGASAAESESVLMFLLPPAAVEAQKRHHGSADAAASGGSANKVVPTVLQIDLAPTLSAAMGVPTPRDSAGKLIDGAIFGRGAGAPEHQNALLANARQLWELLVRSHLEGAVDDNDFSRLSQLRAKMLSRAEQAGAAGGATSSAAGVQAVRAATAFVTAAQEEVLGRVADLDDLIMLRATAIMGVCAAAALWATLTSGVGVRVGPIAPSSALVIAGQLVQLLSLYGSSLIENEHASWGWLCCTACAVLLFASLRASGGEDSGGGGGNGVFEALACAVLLRVARRSTQVINFARLNGLDTGTALGETAVLVPWAWEGHSAFSALPAAAAAALPVAALLSLLVSGAVLLRRWSHGFALMSNDGVGAERGNGSSVLNLMLRVLLPATWLAGMAAGAVLSVAPHMRPLDAATEERVAQALLLCCAAVLVLGALPPLVAMHLRPRSHRALGVATPHATLATTTSAAELSFWLLLVLLHRGANIEVLAALLPLRLVLAGLLERALQRRELPLWAAVVLLSWFGLHAFFCLGNSHSISTIDMSSAYLGLSSFNRSAIGLLVFAKAYSGPLLFSFALPQLARCATGLAGKAQSHVSLGYHLLQCGALLLCIAAMRIAAYAAAVFLFRYHLFVWSVFAPKLLYEVAYSVAQLAAALAMCACVLWLRISRML